MNILSVISSTKLKEINIKGFNGFFTLNNLYYSTNLRNQKSETYQFFSTFLFSMAAVRQKGFK